MRGWVMSGGGARGAYEAGVLRYVYEVIGKKHGITVAPDVICGTSIGALTGAWTGALGAEGMDELTGFWRHMEPEQVYKLDALDLARAPLKMLQTGAPLGAQRSLLNPAPFYKTLRERLPWHKLYERIDRGELHSLVVAATEVSNGLCTWFADGVAPARRQTATTRLVPTRIQLEHIVASAAIPFVFPVVQVEGAWYVDGALRQNTPLSPAIELGVTQALVVGCSHSPSIIPPKPITTEPTPAFLAGKALSALLLDPVEENMRRMAAINRILLWGQQAYPDFMERLSSELRPYRVVRTVYIRPTENVATMAGRAFMRCVDKLPWPTRTMLSAVYNQEGAEEADLMSSLLFHKSYTAELEQLGYDDAGKQEQNLIELFTQAD